LPERAFPRSGSGTRGYVRANLNGSSEIRRGGGKHGDRSPGGQVGRGGGESRENRGAEAEGSLAPARRGVLGIWAPMPDATTRQTRNAQHGWLPGCARNDVDSLPRMVCARKASWRRRAGRGRGGRWPPARLKLGHSTDGPDIHLGSRGRVLAQGAGPECQGAGPVASPRVVMKFGDLPRGGVATPSGSPPGLRPDCFSPQPDRQQNAANLSSARAA